MSDRPEWLDGIRGGPEKQKRYDALSQEEKLERLAKGKGIIKAEARRRARDQRRAWVDDQPTAGKDRGPWLVNGMTMEERVGLGIEGIEPVSIVEGSGLATVRVMRRRYLHPLDRYLKAGKLGPLRRRHTLALHVAGMALHEDFVGAMAMAKVSSGYEPRGSAGVQEYSDARLAARKRMNLLFRGRQWPDGTIKVYPLLRPLAGRVALHVCCLGEGTSSFDKAMAQHNRRWKKGTAMDILIEALEVMSPFYQARR